MINCIKTKFNLVDKANNANLQLLNIIIECLQEQCIYYNPEQIKKLFKQTKPKRMHWPSEQKFIEASELLE